MPDRYIEKKFLYVLCISLFLHLGVGAALYFFPSAPVEPSKEPVFIDLQQMPEQKQPPEQLQEETRRRSEQRTRVIRESTPRGDTLRDVQAIEKRTEPKSERQSLQVTKPVQTSQKGSGRPPVVPRFFSCQPFETTRTDCATASVRTAPFPRSQPFGAAGRELQAKVRG